jgi:uncharacterized protein YqjF (DUF2071 family)
VAVELLRPLVPAPLQVQQYDGSAWLGVVPFRMEGVMRRPLPDLPGLSAFPELNVRTYVEYDGRPGVWFLSLDATNSLAVFAARRWFDLPYHRASSTFPGLEQMRLRIDWPGKLQRFRSTLPTAQCPHGGRRCRGRSSTS